MDCEKLSSNALEIFKKLEPFFPPGPWKTPQWQVEGIVISNWTYDLRKQVDRKRLEDWHLHMVGFKMREDAKRMLEKGGTLLGIEHRHIPQGIQHHLEILLILSDLDFQIETGDFIDMCEASTPT